MGFGPPAGIRCCASSSTPFRRGRAATRPRRPAGAARPGVGWTRQTRQSQNPAHPRDAGGDLDADPSSAVGGGDRPGAGPGGGELVCPADGDRGRISLPETSGVAVGSDPADGPQRGLGASGWCWRWPPCGWSRPARGWRRPTRSACPRHTCAAHHRVAHPAHHGRRASSGKGCAGCSTNSGGAGCGRACDCVPTPGRNRHRESPSTALIPEIPPPVSLYRTGEGWPQAGMRSALSGSPALLTSDF